MLMANYAHLQNVYLEELVDYRAIKWHVYNSPALEAGSGSVVLTSSLNVADAPE